MWKCIKHHSISLWFKQSWCHWQTHIHMQTCRFLDDILCMCMQQKEVNKETYINAAFFSSCSSFIILNRQKNSFINTNYMITDITQHSWWLHSHFMTFSLSFSFLVLLSLLLLFFHTSLIHLSLEMFILIFAAQLWSFQLIHFFHFHSCLMHTFTLYVVFLCDCSQHLVTCYFIH